MPDAHLDYEFVRVWRSSRSLDEVLLRLDLSMVAAVGRWVYLTGRGVSLRRFWAAPNTPSTGAPDSGR